MRRFQSIFIFFVTFLIALVATACSGGGTTPAPTESTPASVPTDIQDVWEGDQPISHVSEGSTDTKESTSNDILSSTEKENEPVSENDLRDNIEQWVNNYPWSEHSDVVNEDTSWVVETVKHTDRRYNQEDIHGEIYEVKCRSESGASKLTLTLLVKPDTQEIFPEPESWYIDGKEDWNEQIAVPEGGCLSNFPVRRYDGNGWHIYLPVSAWNKVQVDELFADNQWRWESEYQTGSSLTIDHFTSTMEVLWADAQKQGYTPLDSEKYIWEMSSNGTSGQYYFSEAVDGGCFQVSILWTDANITDHPHIATEPDVLRLVAESFTVDTE